jgi:uncharacterized protein (TIGR03492 family)
MAILFISNGFGEDQIASNLINSLKKSYPSTPIYAIPLVGEGSEYIKKGITPLIKTKPLPSGGFIRSPISLFKDLFSGMLLQHIKHILLIKKYAKLCTATVCVGDVFCLTISSFFNKTKKVFLPTAKSNLFMKHSKIELLLIKKLARLVFARDQATTDSLKEAGINSFYDGNPMFDGFKFPNENLLFSKNQKVIGVAPGSKQEAYDNFAYVLKVINKIIEKDSEIHFLLGKAKSLNINKLAKAIRHTNWQILEPENIIINSNNPELKIYITEDFSSVIAESNVLIGLAGTANEQAVYFGKPVICFKGFGPQSTKKRFREQKKLLGDLLFFIDNHSLNIIADKTLFLLNKFNKKQTIQPQTSASDSITKQILNLIIAN